MPDEPKCIKCDHPRTGHSRRKCEEWIDDNGKECPCRVTAMQQHMFK